MTLRPIALILRCFRTIKLPSRIPDLLLPSHSDPSWDDTWCRDGVLLGVSGGHLHDRLVAWIKVEPAHYQQMRNLNVRLLWNQNQHELKTPLPYIRTIWEANHRIHSTYPKYSYSRFSCYSLDGGMGGSLLRASYVIVGTEKGRKQVVSLFGVHEDKFRLISFSTPALSIKNEYSGQASEVAPGKRTC